MRAFETYHERQQRIRGDISDIYVYEDLPTPLRIQIIQIAEDVLGDETAYCSYGNGPTVQRTYKFIVESMRRSIGAFRLPPTKEWANENYREELRNYLLSETNVEKTLSAVELVCRLIERMASQYKYRRQEGADKIAADGIADINARFKQHGVGFEYDGELIRIDSELVHAEAVKPALALLQEKSYAGAQDEFLKAFDQYRQGNTKEALTDALKAIESTMKVICDKRDWPFAEGDSSKRLIDICLQKGLIPSYWQSHFSSLRSMLESSVPTARNKNGAHGQGLEIQQVPDHLASYVLHMTASTIVFLVKAEKAMS